MNPVFASSKQRYLQLFESVAANSANRRLDAVQARIITQYAADAGVEAFTRTSRNGSQIWVTVKDGQIINAGVNAAGAAR